MPGYSPQIVFADFIGPLDVAVFFGVLFLTFGAAWYGNRRQADGVSGDGILDYLLMGRRLTLPLFTATLVATWYGGIFGVTEISFESGVYNFVTQGAFWYAAYLAFAFFLVGRLRDSGAATLPELAGKLFGPKSQKIAGVFNFFNILPVAYVISIGLFVQTIFGGTLLTCTIVGTLLVASVTLWGGLRSVVFSDVVQFLAMCLAVFFVALFCTMTFGGVGFLKAHLPATHFDATGGHSWGETLVWGFIALETLVDPSFYQRCFAAKSERVARWGIILSTLVWCGFDICTTLGGMYARAVVPAAAANQSYMILAMQVLPQGLRGFFLAGVLATILSTLDSFLFVAANTLSYDLAPRRWRENVNFGHVCTFVAGVCAIGLSLFFSGSVKDAWKTIGSYAAGGLLIPMLAGLAFPQRIADGVFVAATLSGAATITIWRLLPREGFLANVDCLYPGMVATVLVLLGAIILPRSSREP